MKLPYIKMALLPFVMATGLPGAASAATAPVSEIVVDARSGRVLYEAAGNRSRPPASLVKMMTLLLTFEAIDAGRLRSTGKVVMTPRGARQPASRLGLAAGRTIGLDAAMRAVAVISANDVAVALAERVAGSEALFVQAMNRRARKLGMTATRFTNATGLAPSGGLTTARDMATLARYIISHHPVRYRIFSTPVIRWRGQVRPNHNHLLGKLRGVDGVKTGYTVPAGYNLAASGRRGDKRVVVVVLGARSAAARDLLVSNLLESGFSSPRATGQVSRRRSR
ncbi:D-alanyl-D-alanine carboxypeptidase family protein [Sphingomonas mollis]|uniref:D-alanyl-D-alanine carboxypeptidase n=1 Tax=Sphingomonas mollis TaxID=2795726 RepID=A0ABS0XJD9_9SPHN|nr:D-alanyl-D-alanine carboxypeptidase family protein [Sphingomonas sp. BT553]MBJ6120174.1 D-alanyl-D-alanine carboxypeptidase [Sphingomonas sp. BT553]